MRVFLFLIFFFISSRAIAQQTIFNVPSANITEKNKIFLQHQSSIRANGPKKFWGTTNYAAYGLGNNAELDATLFNLNSPNSKNATISLGPKITLPLMKSSYQPKLTAGFSIPISLQRQGVGHWFYSSGSFVIPETKTRLTAGINNGTKQIFGRNVTCFIGGFEQEISKKISLMADWYSGNHDLGMSAIGFSYALPREFMLYAGYQIPNSKRVMRNSAVIEVAKEF